MCSSLDKSIDFIDLSDKVSELENVVRQQSSYIDYILTEVNRMKEIIIDKVFVVDYLDNIDMKDLEQYIRNRKIKKINETKN